MTLRYIKKFIILFCLSVCMCAIPQACSINQSNPSDHEIVTEIVKDESPSESLDPPRSTSLKESQKVFTARNPKVMSRIGELELIIRMATPAEIPKDNYKKWLFFPAEGAGSLALGLVAPPMYASALVVGGAFLIPAGIFGYLHEKGIWDSINDALSNAEFTVLIDRAMIKRLNAAFTKESLPHTKIEIIVQAFGIVDTCLVVSADFKLRSGDTLLKQDHMQITELDSSKDAPPPQCASLEYFAENEGRLIKDTFAEYDSILDLYQKWQKEAVGKHSVPIIQKLGKALNVDGVLVVRIKEQKPWGVTEGLLNIALMNIPLFYNMASPNIGAWIYESTSGRLVWREEHSLFGNGTASAKHSLINLFKDMENAVPEQLVK